MPADAVRFVITLETEDTEKVVSQIEEIPGIAEVKSAPWTESTRVLGYKKGAEQMARLLENCWSCLKDKKVPLQ